MNDPTTRFTDRVDNYVRYRPGYPRAVLETLAAEIGLTPDWTVADIGSGTGISSRLFLANGNIVYGVEPNDAMRLAAEPSPRFHNVKGTAEATTLEDRSIDLVVAAQAFHWFDRKAFRRECERILRPGGWIAVMWNVRLTDTTPFLREYEAMLLRYGTDYQQIRHENILDAERREVFHDGYETRVFPNEQVLDFEGLRGRHLSSSYAPGPDHPDHPATMAELERIFRAHHVDGRVRFEYETQLFYGR